MKVAHMSGAGNDFAVIDARGQKLDLEKLALSLCKLTGADGFMAVDDSQKADFRLHFYNSDGSRASLCGNGSRCICKYAYDRGIAGETMTVETDAGLIYGSRIGENEYRIRLTDPQNITLQIKPGVDYCLCGVPHAAVELPTLSWERKEALRARAAALRHDPIFPEGANVSFYSFLSPDTVRILSYERGVEDYTLACGTGCGALTAMLYRAGKLPGGVLTALNPGGDLQMQIEGENGQITALYQQGPAEYLEELTADTATAMA